MKTLYSLVVASFLVITSLAQADPSPGIQWLVDQPTSLFDRGIDALSRAVRSIADEAKPDLQDLFLPIKHSNLSAADAEYNNENNTINLYFSVRSTNEASTQENCIFAIKEIRLFLIEWTTNNFSTERDPEVERRWANEMMSNLFSHSGYQHISRPEALGAELARNTVMRLSYINTLPQPALKCETRLNGGPVSIIEGE